MSKLPELKPPTGESTNIDAIAHHDGRLWVRFKGRPTVYSYAGAPADLHGQFMTAKSPGKFFRENVFGKFEHEKHEPEKD